MEESVTGKHIFRIDFVLVNLNENLRLNASVKTGCLEELS